MKPLYSLLEDISPREKKVLSDPRLALKYIINTIQGPVPEAEDIIKKLPGHNYAIYMAYIGKPELLNIILDKKFNIAIKYAKDSGNSIFTVAADVAAHNIFFDILDASIPGNGNNEFIGELVYWLASGGLRWKKPGEHLKNLIEVYTNFYKRILSVLNGDK